MNLETLNRHFELVDRLNRDRALLQTLWDRAHPGAQVLTGMPHGGGVSDKVGNLATEIADVEAQIQYMEAVVQSSERELLPYITSIPDTQTRLIFRLRFLRGMAWKEVAGVVGGYNTADSVKMICYRFLGADEKSVP